MIQLELLEIALCSRSHPPRNQPQSTPTCPCCQFIPPDTQARELGAAGAGPIQGHRAGQSPCWVPGAQRDVSAHEQQPGTERETSGPMGGSWASLREQRCGSVRPGHAFPLADTARGPESWHLRREVRGRHALKRSLFSTDTENAPQWLCEGEGEGYPLRTLPLPRAPQIKWAVWRQLCTR